MKTPWTLDAIKKSKVGQLPENLSALCAVESSKQKPEARGALGSVTPVSKASRGRMATGGPVLRVTLISLETRLRDSDNPEYKPLRDAIARSLDLDDADSTIEWHYHQIKSATIGTLVLIQTL